MDFKRYDKTLFQDKKFLFYIIFDNKKLKVRNCISLNPLDISNRKYSGPDWYSYPVDFFKVKKKIKKDNFNLFISQGGTDANNNLNKLMNVLNFVKKNYIKKCFIKIPRNSKINFKNKNKNKIIIKRIKNVKKISSIYKKINIAITGCGNFSYELSFFGIPSIYTSSEKKEIIRGKLLQKKKLGKFFYPNQTKLIANELNRIMNSANYYSRLSHKKIFFFKKNGLVNILNLIKSLKKKYEFQKNY